VPETTRNA